MIIDSTQSEIYTVKNQDKSIPHISSYLDMFFYGKSVTVESRKFEVLGTVLLRSIEN